METFDGSRIEMNINPGVGVTHESLVLPTPGLLPGDPGYFSHYEMYAVISGWGHLRLKNFLIQPAAQTRSPCLQFIPDRFRHVRLSDEELDKRVCEDYVERNDEPTLRELVQYINMQRFDALRTNLFASVSVAPTEQTNDSTAFNGYNHLYAYDIAGMTEWPDSLFYDATIEDPLEKLNWCNLRKDEVEAFCKELHPDFFIASVIQMTLPLNGRLYGVLDGNDPRTGGPIGGISLISEGKLNNLTGIFIVKEKDTERLSAENINKNLPPGETGQVVLIADEGDPVTGEGRIGSIDRTSRRGVVHIVMVNPMGSSLRAMLSIFNDLDRDPIQF